MILDKDKLTQVVKNTPLVSIDIIVRDGNNRYLLGNRINEPAKGYWFVPGGRISKNETLADAFKNISERELGMRLEIADANFLGVHEHMYDQNFAEEKGFGTHYVVLAFEVFVKNLNTNTLPSIQHREWKLVTLEALRECAGVHENTKKNLRTMEL